MLGKQHIHKVHVRVGLANRGNRKVFFKFFVIILNEVATILAPSRIGLGWKVLICVDAADRFAVD